MASIPCMEDLRPSIRLSRTPPDPLGQGLVTRMITAEDASNTIEWGLETDEEIQQLDTKSSICSMV